MVKGQSQEIPGELYRRIVLDNPFPELFNLHVTRKFFRGALDGVDRSPAQALTSVVIFLTGDSGGMIYQVDVPVFLKLIANM